MRRAEGWWCGVAERIQLKRTKGWKMPPNTVKVARPAAWGNPYPVAVFGRDLAIALFRNSLQGFWSPGLFDGLPDDSLIDKAYAIHRSVLFGDVRQLRGQNVACFCGLDEACHGDVLLELANEPI